MLLVSDSHNPEVQDDSPVSKIIANVVDSIKEPFKRMEVMKILTKIFSENQVIFCFTRIHLSILRVCRTR